MKGDILRRFNGAEVKDSRHIQQLVGDTDIGTKVNIVVWRNGKEIPLTLQVAEFEKAEEQGLIASNEKTLNRKMEEKTETVVGLVTQDITPVDRERMSIPSDTKGAVITFVAPDSDAATKDLRVGDLILGTILEGAQTPVTSSAALKKAVENLKKMNRDKITLVISRQGYIKYITIEFEPEKAG